MRRSWALSAFVSLSLLLCEVARASPQENPQASSQPDPIRSTALPSESPTLKRRLLATGYTLGPGLLISGGGHWITGDSEGASKLLWMKLGGLSGVILGGVVLARSGASELVTPWVVPTLLVSGSAFTGASVLDAVGVWGSSTASEAPSSTIAPSLSGRGGSSLELSFASRATSTRHHGLSGVAWSHQLGRYAYRLSGSWTSGSWGGTRAVSGFNAPSEGARYHALLERSLTQGNGWSLWTRLGYSAHLNKPAQVTLQQGEFTLRAPIHFGRWISPNLNSMSGEVALGWSGGAVSYAQGSVDSITGILGGFRLTHHSLQDRLRVGVTYNHRHDGWEGGAIVTGLGSGILGFIQPSVSARFGERWWVESRAAFGSAHLYTLSLCLADPL